MDDFTAKPGVPNQFGLVQGEANAIAPGKRMLSAMTPTIVLDSDGPASGWLPVRPAVHHHHHRRADHLQRGRLRDGRG
jgi:hypothetical protein